MSLGKKLLSAVIEDDDRAFFRSLSRDVFLAENGEQAAYDFVAKHLRRYKQMPSIETAFANSIELPEIDEPVDYYAVRLVDRAIFNVINHHQGELSEAMETTDMDRAQQILIAQLAGIRSIRNPMEYTSLAEAGQRVLQQYEIAHSIHGLQGVDTGWATLNAQTSGLSPGDLFVLVSRPFMGKTYMLLKMAHAAWMAGHSVVFVSMEMLTEAIVRRWVGLDAKINPKYIKTGRLSRWTRGKMIRTVESYQSGAPVHFMAGNFKKNVGSIESVIEQLSPDILFIDASYLLTPSVVRRGASKSEDASQIIKEQKGIATGYAIPVATTVQFNRQETTNGKGSTRMDLKNIGGTDSVGQDADVIMGLRKPRSPYAETYRVAEMLKVRDGECADFPIDFSFYPMNFNESSNHDVMALTRTSGSSEPTDTDYML